jgi:hypothetical protein
MVLPTIVGGRVDRRQPFPFESPSGHMPGGLSIFRAAEFRPEEFQWFAVARGQPWRRLTSAHLAPLRVCRVCTLLPTVGFHPLRHCNSGYLHPVPRCGIVALAGLPNAGKSTLLNALVGEPLAAVSPKPQTTRVPVRGLVTDAATQIVLVDPAGLMDPAYPLQRAMRQSAVAAIRDADLVAQLHPLPDFPAPDLGALVPEAGPIAASLTTARITMSTGSRRWSG